MCGITGFISNNLISGSGASIVLEKMMDKIIHRGPDDAGQWLDLNAGVALGFRRLSIIDLSEKGSQPMSSENGRYVIVYNGEVYNFPELKKTLENQGHLFRGYSDTEVVLAAIEEWGIENAVKRFVGMFAFAVWDVKDHILTIVRDRIGIKPLFYTWGNNGTFLFASELKSLKAHPDFMGVVDHDALAIYFRYTYIPAPYSIYKNVWKLPPGSILKIRHKKPRDFSSWHDPASEGFNQPRAYWLAKSVFMDGQNRLFPGSEDEAIAGLHGLLKEAVRSRMISDVPLGVLLSGGIDSSLITALMQSQSSKPIKTFSAGFLEEEYNEAGYAMNVAHHLGTDHTEMYVTMKEAMEIIPRLPSIYDEPFADVSQIPTVLISEFARKHVTVALSGDGGDELFCGYPRYWRTEQLWKLIVCLPSGLRDTIGKGMMNIASSRHSYAKQVLEIINSKKGSRRAWQRLEYFAENFSAKNKDDFYRDVVSIEKDPRRLVLQVMNELPTPMSKASLRYRTSEFMRMMMYWDLTMYHPDDILVKVDRASMNASLEVRIPLIDHRIVEYSATLPLRMLYNNRSGKSILRKILYKYVPQKIVDRPKKGFAVPLGAWLRTDLRDWAENLLSEKRLKEDGYLNPEPIRKHWRQHLSGERDWKNYLWNVLMFQAWLDQN